MSETAMKLVVDCALPDKARVLLALERGVESTFALIREGKLSREEGQQRVQLMLDHATETAAAPEREQLIPLDEAELAQRALDEAEAGQAVRRLLRQERGLRLAACDWTQLPDAPLAAEQAEAWRVYRQQLRDWPSGLTDPFDPPPWPEPPAGKGGS